MKYKAGRAGDEGAGWPGRPREEDVVLSLRVFIRIASGWDVPFIALYQTWIPLYKIVFVALPDCVGCLALIGLGGVEGSGNILEKGCCQDQRLGLSPDCVLFSSNFLNKNPRSPWPPSHRGENHACFTESLWGLKWKKYLKYQPRTWHPLGFHYIFQLERSVICIWALS